MPRRIRLRFEEAQGRHCGLTATDDSVVVTSYRTRNYGVNYSEGFQHPLTPYYRQNSKTVVKLPVHPAPGGISYRLWPGLVVRSKDGLREPAQAVRDWMNRAPRSIESRFTAFGYDMDNMKARAWIEGACATLARHCVRRVLWLPGFPLVEALPSGSSAVALAPLFAAFTGSTAPSDFFIPCVIGFGFPLSANMTETPAPLGITVGRWR